MSNSLLLILLFLLVPVLHAADAGAETEVSSHSHLSQEGTAPEIRIAYPWPNEAVGSVRSVFVYGSVSPSSGTLTVNGSSAALTGLGQFLQVIPVEPGTFTIRAEFLSGSEVVAATRAIVVSPPPGPPPPGKAAVMPLEPKADLLLKSGDWVRVAAWAQPGGAMAFRIKGVVEDAPMAETAGPDPGVYFAEYLKDPVRTGGYYVGAYQLKGTDRAKDREIEFSFKHPAFGKAKAASPGRLTADPGFWRVGQVSARLAGTRSGSDAGQLYFFQQGTRFLIDGKAGERWRIRLSGTEEAWIDEKNVELRPEGTPPPSAKLETIVVRSSDSHADVEFTVGAPVPAVVSQEDGVVKVSFYDTREHVNWIVYDDNDSFVREVRWRQENSDKASAFIHLREGERLWGYSLRRTGERYVLTLRRAPRAGRRSLFEGLTVVLDPGHSGPDLVGIGPLSTREQDANLSLARRVRDRLLSEKASVVLTRETASEVVPLTRRTEIAVENKADIFLSLHFNAFPPGIDPLAEPRGFSMFHHQPQSVELSRELQLSYRDRIPLASNGMRFADFHVIRMTEMPSVLLESAFIMLPEQEALILDPKFQDKLSHAIVEALWRFLRKNLREPMKVAPAVPQGPRPKPGQAAGPGTLKR
ncbi:MAG: N-acetylmuramoyl-L-alanine amidase [Elusimicrobia bacterium]|nr:N-acetylmuramoyl-L-alanine amidase [Elusimicrobiota bacterium]